MSAPWRRVLLVVPVALAAVGVWFGVRWCIGNTMAQRPPDIETARVAARLAPDDPQAQFALAVHGKKTFEVEELEEALQRYEKAVSLSPNDYRLWMELGRVRGQTGDTAGGERALRRAIELAPHYALPRWHLGNMLLREGRWDDAFAELRHAADADPTLRPQVFNLAWRVYDADVPTVISTVGDSATARAQLADYLMNVGRLDIALGVWGNLSSAEKMEQRATGDKLAKQLFGAKLYHTMLEVRREIAPGGAAETSIARLLNGGFEEDIGPAGKELFSWQVTPVAQSQINIDPRTRHSGNRSLRLAFNAPTALEFNNISQFIVVEPSTRYRLSYYVRTEELSGPSTLATSVEDAGDPGRMQVGSGQLPNGTNDWQQVTLDFTTSAQTQAITVRLSRAPCYDAVCPLFGKIWYDDFDLQRISGGGGSGARGRDIAARNSPSTSGTR